MIEIESLKKIECDSYGFAYKCMIRDTLVGGGGGKKHLITSCEIIKFLTQFAMFFI